MDTEATPAEVWTVLADAARSTPTMLEAVHSADALAAALGLFRDGHPTPRLTTWLSGSGPEVIELWLEAARHVLIALDDPAATDLLVDPDTHAPTASPRAVKALCDLGALLVTPDDHRPHLTPLGVLLSARLPLPTPSAPDPRTRDQPS